MEECEKRLQDFLKDLFQEQTVTEKERRKRDKDFMFEMEKPL